jgi:uncharacterized membrane protein
MLALLQSRKFWVAVVGVVFVVLEAYGKAIDTEQLTGALVILSGYMVALAVGPWSPDKWLIFKSRELWATVVGLVVLLSKTFGVELPFTPETMLEFALFLSGFIAITGVSKRLRA